ncbi:MAG: hypothetical protein SFW08_13425 [Gemmatimonadaceae bacterium]|nr:hypothetical protein [Gemmatimonadaceae bacterium]
MKFVTVALALVAALSPATVRSQGADSAAVAGTLQRFFDALRTKNASAVQAELHEAARFTLLRPAPGGAGDSVQVVQLSGAAFVQATTGGTGPGLDEPIRNLKIQIDLSLATVWAEYQVRRNGAVTHCGYDAFHLVKTPAGWKILTVADSFRRQGCGGPW